MSKVYTLSQIHLAKGKVLEIREISGEALEAYHDTKFW